MRNPLLTSLLAVVAAMAASCATTGRHNAGRAGQAADRPDSEPLSEANGATLQYHSPNLMAGDTSFELSTHAARLVGLDSDSPLTALSKVRTVRLGRTAGLAVHGGHALRAELPRGDARFALDLPPVLLGSGTYTISVYARGHDESIRLRWRLRGARTVVAHEPFPVGEDWWRYALTFEISARGSRKALQWGPRLLIDRFRPSGVSLGSTWLDLDAVQVEAGPQATAYRPAEPITLLTTASGGPVQDLGRTVWALQPGDAMKATSRLRNNTRRALRLRVSFERGTGSADAWTDPSRPLPLDPGEVSEARHTFGPTPPGWAMLRCRVLIDDEPIGQSAAAVAALPCPWREDPAAVRFVGLSEPPRHTAGRALQGQGADEPTTRGGRFLCRLAVSVKATTTEQARELAADMSEPIDAITSLNGEPVVHLRSRAPDTGVAASQPSDLAGSARSEDDRDALLADVVRGIAPKIRFWLVDGVDADRADRVRSLRRCLPDEAAAGRILVLAPTAGVDSDDADPDALLRSPDMEAADGIVLRCDPPRDTRQAWAELIDRTVAGVVRACIRADKPHLPRWAMTTRWPWPEEASGDDRAALIHQTALLLAKHGVRRWLVPPIAPSAPGRPPLACPIEVAALRGLEWHLADARFRHEHTAKQGIRCLVFDEPGKPLAAIWATTVGGDASRMVAVVPPTIDAYDLFGRRLKAGKRPRRIPVTAAPVYLRPQRAGPTWLDAVRFAKAAAGDGM